MEGKSELHGVPFDGGSHYVKNVSDIPKIVRAYWGAVSLIDKNVGRMLDKIDELGMSEDTIIVFTTDHGEYMGDHGMMAKGGFLWENLVNVPFICKNPGSSFVGERTSALFSFTDIVPTLLDIAGIEDHNMALDGVSQKSVLSGDKESIRSVVSIHHPTSNEQDKYSCTYGDNELNAATIDADLHSIVTQRWKLVYYAGQKEGLLFDLDNDPQELNNLYNQDTYLKVQYQLEKRLLDELIFENDKQALVNKRNADHYHTHLMTYDMWKPEFDAIKMK